MTIRHDGHAGLSAADFERIEAAFAELVALDGALHAQVLAGRFADRPDLQRVTAELLEAHGRLKPDPDDGAGPSGVGATIGAYRLVRRIGEGGMGEVFLAERADGLFSQRVAIKITRSTFGDAELKRRFVVERRILASLTHDNIVRLLDGGTTDTGQAFLIMEHVEGLPLTGHCRERRLSLADRLRLFGDVCRAVRYAHEHGVVHRDLKPANILVTSDHVPKVLDFGVAKLLEGHGDMAFVTTNALAGPLTPNYASPEQVRGLPVTTASDVYALGVILYELVTDCRPYETQGLPLDQVIEVVLHQEPRRPSEAAVAAGARRADADIDAIVLKALSKEAGTRYASAGELASDVTRWLAGDPVLARAPSAAYMLGRLARRHRPLVTVAALALVAILGASAAAVRQWQAARREQARAEQRFNEVRRLANAVIFKIHDAIVPLQGSTPVRRMIVDEAIGYLQRLGAESAGDPALTLELAAAHRQIAAILGNVSAANLGDREGAIKQYERARELTLPMLGPAASYEVVLAVVETNLRLPPLYAGQRNHARAQALAREGVDLVTGFRERNPADQRAAELQARAYFGLASSLPTDEARPVWLKTLDYYEQLLKSRPDDANTQRNVALVCKYLGGGLEAFEAERAVTYYRRSLELDEHRLQQQPDDPRVWFDAAISFSNVASAAERLGDRATAAPMFERSLDLRRRLAASDPANASGVERLGYLLARIGTFHQESDPAESLKYSREALSVLEPLFARTKANSTRQIIARALVQVGEAETRLQSSKACAAFVKAHRLFRDSDPTLLDASEQHLASTAAKRVAACATPADE